MINLGLKVDAFGFKLDPNSESKYLYGDQENVHVIDEDWNLVPGSYSREGHRSVVQEYKRAKGNVEKMDVKRLKL